MADGLVNLGSEKLNINTTTAKGLEKAIGVIAKFIITTQGKVNGLFYGKFALGETDGNAIKRAIDKGIANVLQDLAEIDLCNIINYAVNQIPGGTPFDPNKSPTTNDPVARKKYVLQKKAYNVQTYIDQYYNSYIDKNNTESKNAVFNLIKKISDELSDSILSINSGFNDPELVKQFPQLSTASNFLQDALGFTNRYTDFRQIPNNELQKIINLIDKIRFYCILVQGLNSPTSILNFANTATNGAIQEEIRKLTNIIDPARLIPLLKTILNTANSLNSIGRVLLRYISTLKSLIRIAVLIIKAFNILKVFFKALPIPSMFSTVGANITINDIFQDKLKEQGEKRLIKRLSQINIVLDLMYILVSSMIIGVQNIIDKLNIVLLNLEACNNIDKSLIQDIKNTISNLQETNNQLKDFSTKYNDNKSRAEKSFGNYTIEIIPEELADEGISIRRRYGIARGSDGYIAVKSTPTFASLDLIIINEVKALLVSKGFVKPEVSTLSLEDTIIVQEAIHYLGDSDITINNIQTSDIDASFYENENDSLGLNKFINNLSGGKALRKKVRDAMKNSISNLGSSLNQTRG